MPVTTSTVLIPCFNGATFLTKTLDSLLSQTVPPDQIIVINDGSIDDSAKIIDSYAANHPVIKPIHHAVNKGKAACLNECFASINSTYFFLQDADDIAESIRIERQFAFMEENPEVGCSSSFVRYINAEDRIIGKAVLDLTSPQRLQEYLQSNDPFGLFCPATVLRGEVVTNPSLHFRGEYWPADDVDLWNRIAEAGWLVLAQPEYLVQYRIHATSAVTSSFMSTRERYEFVRHNLRARRGGRVESTWEQFRKARAKRPLLKKINDYRKALAKGLYRSAGFLWGGDQRLTALLTLGMAAILQPSYVVRRFWNQAF